MFCPISTRQSFARTFMQEAFKMKVSERDVATPTPPRQQQSSDQRSVLSLLKMLHDRMRHEKRSNFMQILPAYEQILTHVRSALSRRSSLSSKWTLTFRMCADFYIVYRKSQRQRIADPPSHILHELGRVRLMLREHPDMYVQAASGCSCCSLQ